MKTSYSEMTRQSQTGSEDYKVKFFSLKPGETAIVRILVDSIEDLSAYGYHVVELPDGKTRRVDCIRELREDISKCPMCASGVPFEQQIFVHLLQYYPDGRVEPKIWGRKPPVSSRGGNGIISQIGTALESYGPLSNYVSSISRTGVGLDTRYSVNINLPEQIYPSASFPKDLSGFEGYSEVGTFIKEWTAEEMNTYITTGSLPQVQSNNNPSPQPSFNPNTAPKAYSDEPVYPMDSVEVPFVESTNNPATVAPADPLMSDTIPTPPTMGGYGNPFSPTDTSAGVVNRPVRRFS